MKTSFCLKFREFIPSTISSCANICDIKLGIAEVLIVSASSYSLGSSAIGVSSFSVWLCGSKIVNQSPLN